MASLREIQASEAKSHLARLLDDVEHGETIVITRHGRAIARLVPETGRRQEEIAKALAELDELRKTIPRLTFDEILAARQEGHQC